MKITFLGTGAADWGYEISKEKDFRRFSSLLIDDCFLIDPGPHVPNSLKEFNKKAEDIKFVINTHKHFDHYDENTLVLLKQADLISFNCGDEKVFGKYTVKAVSANHATCENSIHFIISDGDKKLFYGLDGAWLMYDEVEEIIKQKIDFAVLDGTIGEVKGDFRVFSHNNLYMVMEMQSSLKEYIGQFCISHLARTLHESHDEVSAKMEKQNIIVAYDGLEINI